LLLIPANNSSLDSVKRSVIRIIYLSAILLVAYFLFPSDDKVAERVGVESIQKVSESKNSNKDVKSGSDTALLDVAFMSEAPDGNWVHPWSNACEETVILMADKYYEGKKSIGVSEAKTYLQSMFEKEIEHFGTERNADASQMMFIISKYTDFKGTLKTNPTLDEIKDEIKAGRPVISLHKGFDLKNDNIEFSPTKSSYHTVIVVGFDDAKKTFIVHDPGDEVDGEEHLYGYDLFMNSLHDYDIARDKADGVPTVIFTSTK